MNRVISKLKVKTFPITNCPKWSYVTKAHRGTCVVDGETITMRFRVRLFEPREVPDVLEIEEFCKAMGEVRATVETYTARLAAFLGVTVTGRGETDTHGPITATIKGAK